MVKKIDEKDAGGHELRLVSSYRSNVDAVKEGLEDDMVVTRAPRSSIAGPDQHLK
jgi:hypothetical protein